MIHLSKKSLEFLIIVLTILAWIYPILVLWGYFLFLSLSHPFKFSFLLIILIVVILFFVNILIHTLRDNCQLKLNRIKSYSDSRHFFLILRSFKKTDLHEQIIHKGKIIVQNYLLEYIEKAISILGGVLYISGELSFIKSYGGRSPRGVVLKCDDVNWFELFKVLSSLCRAIVIVPQTSEGLTEELEYIIEHKLYNKTIVIMPPEETFSHSKKLWENISSELRHKGFRLPDYDSRGSVFIPDIDLSPAHIVTFKDVYVWKENLMVRNSITKLLEKIPSSNVSLKDAMKQICDRNLIDIDNL